MRGLGEFDISTAVPNNQQTEFGKVPVADAAQLLFLDCLHSEKQEHRFLLLQCQAPPRALLLHLLVYHWIEKTP
jgi:hypothetical protein